MAVNVTEFSPTQVDIKPPVSLEQWKNRSMPDNEFKNTDIRVPKPLKEVKITRGSEIEDYGPLIQKDFEYYSRTRNLETNTQRTQILQDLVDKMTVETGIGSTRVVIMNKGKEYNAFVMPDGTIFISQSILNGLSSIDEIGAVLAHEVGHLYLKTFERTASAGGRMDSAGVSWLHEGVSDSLAKDLGEKAGLNTFAFGTAIEKISGAGRGFVHQGGYMRSSQNVAEHSARHYETSAKEVEPVPMILLGHVRPTNEEIILERIAKNQAFGFSEALSRLHPRDLKTAYGKLLEHLGDTKRYRRYADEYGQSSKMLEQFNTLLTERLLEADFSKEQILAWLTAKTEYNLYLFKTSEEVVNVSKTVAEDIGSDIFDKIPLSVFEERDYIQVLDNFLSNLEKHLYDDSSGPVRGKIPVNCESIIQIVKNIETTKYPLYTIFPKIGKILASYIEASFLKNAIESGNEVEISQVIGFIEELKSEGINVEEIKHGIVGKLADNLDLYEQDLGEEHLVVKNYQKTVIELKKYFGIEDWKPLEDINKEIDLFFADFSLGNSEGRSQTDKLGHFLGNLRRTFDYLDLDDSQRVKFIEYLNAKFSDWQGFKFEFRNNEIPQHLQEGAKVESTRLKIGSILAIALFQKDGPEFYQFLHNIMKNSKIDFSSFSKTNLVNLTSALFMSKEYNIQDFYILGPTGAINLHISRNHLQITDFKQFSQLPVITEIIRRGESADLSSWGNLSVSVKDLISKLDPDAQGLLLSGQGLEEREVDIFSENPLALVLFAPHRQAFLDLASKVTETSDLSSLHEAIQLLYPDGNSKNHFIREIRKKYLLSEDVSLEAKTKYLLDNLESLGLEGVLIMASQIKTLPDYINFREKLGDRLTAYLGGGDVLLRGLAGDLVTSFLSQGYERVIQTAIDDEAISKEISTKFADEWFFANINSGTYTGSSLPRYDKEEKRFITTESSRGVFRSIKDAIETFKNFSRTQRVLTLMKALADEHGAFSTPKAREKLADLVTSALKQKEGFVSDVLRQACLKGQPRLTSFPAANMLAPMIFRGLNVDFVDTKKIIEKGQIYDRPSEKWQSLGEVLTEEDIQKMARSSTRELAIFGYRFAHQPNSFFYNQAQESDRSFQKVTDSLERQLFNGLQNNEAEKAEEIDPNIDAVVKAVEAGGALGVRSLQLSTQLLSFSPAVERRLAQSFDSNPGMNKLIFWERLYKKAQSDPKASAFLNALEIGEYAGGGSLFTTYRAKRRDSVTGQERDIVIKALNVNAEGFIKEYYDLAGDILKEVEKKRGNGGLAKAARLLLNVSREWCVADINDLNFAVDDDRFRGTIEAFNTENGQVAVYAPKREYVDKDIKSEDFASGLTLNKFLSSKEIPTENKKQMVNTLMKFFAFQFKHPGYLFHSDPHVGNYIIDDKGKRLAVIDRSMYLRLKKEDVDVLQGLLKGENPTAFVNQFMTRVLDEWGVDNPLQRRRIWFGVWAALGKEKGSQVIGRKQDNFALLRTMFNSMDHTGLKDPEGIELKVPLKLRLMIRNIEAFRRLGEKYGLRLEDYV